MFFLAAGAALVAAVTWALASLMLARILGRPVSEGGPRTSPAAASLFKNLIALAGFMALMPLTDRASPSASAALTLLLSGLLGFAAGDSLYFAALPRCGVQAAAMVGLLNVPVAAVLAWWFLAQGLSPVVLACMAVVLVGVLLVIREEGAPAAQAQRSSGVLLALAAAVMWALSVVLGHEGLQGVDVVTGGGLRLLGGSLGCVLGAGLVGSASRSRSVAGELSSLFEPLRSAAVARLLLLPALCASLLNQVPYNFALRELPGGVAALLFATTPLFTLPMSRFFGERHGRRALLGTAVGLAGVAGVILGQEPARTVGLAPQTTLVVEPAPVPDEPGLWPRLARTADQQPHLLWTRKSDGASELRLAVLAGEGWLPAESVARGSDWFVNWADFPELALGNDGARWATWLEKLDVGTYAYGIRVRRGAADSDWARPRWLHEDRSPVEHGFTTLTPLAGGAVHAVWLDGRDTLDEAGEADPTGAMGLYCRVLQPAGTMGVEYCIDERVCDCCQTDAALLSDGRLLIAWRDRSEDEVRDISWAAGIPGRAETWSAPAPVAKDGWRIPGCPVNGPAVAAAAGQVSVVWYTQDEERARVLAASADPSLQFGAPVEIDEGHALGRVDVCTRPDGGLIVTWLEGVEGRATWRARLLEDGRPSGPSVTIGEVRGSRQDGFLRLVPTPRGALISYYDARADRLRVKELVVRP